MHYIVCYIFLEILNKLNSLFRSYILFKILSTSIQPLYNINNILCINDNVYNYEYSFEHIDNIDNIDNIVIINEYYAINIFKLSFIFILKYFYYLITGVVSILIIY